MMTLDEFSSAKASHGVVRGWCATDSVLNTLGTALKAIGERST